MDFDKNDLLTIKEAVAYIDNKYHIGIYHETSITRWCRVYNVGKKFGGQWRISKKRLDTFLKTGQYEG